MRTLAMTAFGYAFPKTIGRFRINLCSQFPTCTHEDSPFHPFSLRPQLFSCIIALSGNGYRFCASARALARHPLQMFVYPERWGDFPQTFRPVSRPASLACYSLISHIYFSYIYLFGKQCQ